MYEKPVVCKQVLVCCGYERGGRMSTIVAYSITIALFMLLWFVMFVIIVAFAFQGAHVPNYKPKLLLNITCDDVSI